jgi:hypothetical protein
MLFSVASSTSTDEPPEPAKNRCSAGQPRVLARYTLERTLITTNPIESMISIARTTQRNVKNWKDAAMVRRWTAASMLVAETKFRRIKGYKDMPLLVAALARHAHPVKPETLTTTA